MSMNVSKLDRILRFLVGAGLVVAALLALEGTGRVVALIAGFVLLVTGGAGYCPIYQVCGRGGLRPRVDDRSGR